MNGYRINQAQVKRIMSLTDDAYIKRILMSLELLDNPYQTVQRQVEPGAWPVAVTYGDVAKGDYP